MSTTAYASNGDRDGLKTGMDWAISSQAAWEQVEGSTTSLYRPDRTKRGHECGARLHVSPVRCTLSLLNTWETLTMAEKKFFVTKEELQEAYEKLGTSIKVAEKYGVSKKLVLRYLKRYGIEYHPRHWLTETDKARITELAQCGTPVPAIAAELGFSVTAVRRYGAMAGLTFDDPAHPGVVTTWAGYRKLLRPDHPRADSKGYVAEHVLVMEEHIGRLLAPGEVVHHVNGDKGDNALGNLQLMTDREHRALHATNGDSGWQKYWANAA